MRILKVTQAYAPFLEKGGPAVKVPAIAQRLAQRGHQVTVLTSTHDAGPAGKVQLGEGVEVIFLRSILTYRSTSWNAGLLDFCRRRIPAFEVAHIYGLYDLLGPVAARFCRRSGVPYVLEPMGMYRPIVRGFLMKRLYHRLLGNSLVCGARRVIATSQQEQQELLEEGLPFAQICVRRNGIDLEEFSRLPARGAFRRKLGLAEGVPLVLFLGRLSRKKGLDLLVRAFSSLQEEARLVIVGPEERDGCVDEVQRLRRELRLENRVLLVGPRYGVQKLEALVDADVFVLPSQNENFGNVVAEAIACGTPALLTDRCGIAPLVNQRAGLVVPYAEQAVREGLAKMLRDHDLRERLRAACAPTARSLSWEEPLAQMEVIYREVIEESTAA